MSDFFGLFDDEKSKNAENSSDQGNNTSSNTTDNQSNTTDNQNEGTLQLHKEMLDITKNSTDAGEVVLSKDVVEEQQTVDVPVMHEEVVIKRTPVNNEKSNASISSEENIHIPVSQEQVEVNKYVVTTEEISASKRQVEETQKVEQTVKHEEAHVNTTGSVNIVEGSAGFEDINS